MIELKNNSLQFSFPDVHPEARLTIDFQRTLRIPDDGNDYPLPPGLGRFPIKHVDNYAEKVPSLWIEHGGVMLPMYQSEALWLNFLSVFLRDYRTSYPFAIKVATGKINAVTGENWSDGLQNDPQDYMVSSKQHWLDGYCFEKGFIRQFVAMPLGSGYSAEEQITGEAEYGLPWFDYYDDNSTALKGSEKLKDLKSVVEMGQKKGDVPVPENESVEIGYVKKLGNSIRPYQVREGTF